MEGNGRAARAFAARSTSLSDTRNGIEGAGLPRQVYLEEERAEDVKAVRGESDTRLTLDPVPFFVGSEGSSTHAYHSHEVISSNAEKRTNPSLTPGTQSPPSPVVGRTSGIKFRLFADTYGYVSQGATTASCPCFVECMLIVGRDFMLARGQWSHD